MAHNIQEREKSRVNFGIESNESISTHLAPALPANLTRGEATPTTTRNVKRGTRGTTAKKANKNSLQKNNPQTNKKR